MIRKRFRRKTRGQNLFLWSMFQQLHVLSYYCIKFNKNYMQIGKNVGGRKVKEQEISVDLVVTGGGLSGVCCAITAARKGLKVVLIQDRPVLGGNASSEIRVWALGATSHMGNNNRWAREGGLIDEIMVENMYRNKDGNPIFFDALLLDKVLHESNITLLLNTIVHHVEMIDNETIASVVAFNPQNELTYRISGNLFCDASGDGILSYLSGASYRFGAEEKGVYNEAFSPSKAYGKLLGHTIFLYTKKVDVPVKYVAPTFALQDMKRIPKLHQITPDQFGCNYWWFEYGGDMDTINDSEEIKMELWKVVYGAWNHIKNSGLYPEANNLTLEWVGVIPGKRESRRFEGLYTLTQHDIVQQTVFSDAIAYGGWAIDLHPAEGVYSTLSSCNQFHSVGIYSIPYRCYVSKDIKNLFFAGRIISASHVAFGSTRVMITCAMGGQAIGAAAALCRKNACFPAELLSKNRMEQLQQELCRDGQSIPHVPIKQLGNLAVNAKIQASSTMKLKGFSFCGEWQKLDFSRAMLLPLEKGKLYEFGLDVWGDCDTTIVVDLMISEKPYNYTPDVLVERVSCSVVCGIQKINVCFSKTIPHQQYAFLILRLNPHVQIGLSDQRMTGILSVANKFNKAVNNLGKQLPPEGSGFESFEFFTPERRPQGKLFSLNINPALSQFTVANLLNGYVRPYLQSNAWVAEWSVDIACLSLTWELKQELNGLRLYFDTDADHPMETIQWGHPEDRIPYCIQDFEILDENDHSITNMSGNFRSIQDIEFENTINTCVLKIKFVRKNQNIPLALFGLEVY